MRYVQEFLIVFREYLIRYRKTHQTILLLRAIERIINSDEDSFDIFLPIFACSKNHYKFLRSEMKWKKELALLNKDRACFIIEYIVERPDASLLSRLFESILELNNITLFPLLIKDLIID